MMAAKETGQPGAKKRKIGMFRVYVLKLIFRIGVFLLVLWAYLFKPAYFDLILTKRVVLNFQLAGGTLEELQAHLSQFNILWIYIVWAILMLSMILHLLPINRTLTMGSKKEFAREYVPVEGFDSLQMYRYVQKNNLSAIRVLIAWLSLNAVFGALYVFDIIEAKELILLSLFYYVCDLLCVVIWCPFQSFFIKNKCCVNCRIFNWGHFMMFTPLVFIRNFFTWSLFFTGLIVMLRWEITLLKHPERFWEGSNQVLQCANCQDRMCRIKGPKFLEEAAEFLVPSSQNPTSAGEIRSQENPSSVGEIRSQENPTSPGEASSQQDRGSAEGSFAPENPAAPEDANPHENRGSPA